MKLICQKIALNGTNTVQISNIIPDRLKDAITVNIPYPRVIDGTLEQVGLSKESFDLIDKIISSDIKYGFTSAQMAVIKDGKLVYQNAWGQINSYVIKFELNYNILGELKWILY